jgi:ankyrin repeat protein
MTPLHRAAESGRVGIYQLIIRQVKDKNPENVVGLTPLYFADGHKNIERIFRQFS